MNNFDTRLAARLHGMVDGEPDSAPPVVRVLARGQTAAPHRTAVRLAGASLAVLAVGGAVTTVAVHPWSADRAATTAQPARIELAAAVAASEGTSYKIKVTEHVKSTPGSHDDVTTGAFDPAARTGYLHTPDEEGPGFEEQRLVKGARYLGSAGVDQRISWRRVPGAYTTLDYVGGAASSAGASGDPSALLAILRDEGAVVTRTGTHTYHFTVEVAKKDLLPQSLSDRFAGDLTVGAGQRITTVRFERWLQWDGKAGRKPGPPVDVVVTMAFSDYGVPVTVEAPAGVK
jgi:hypothetical protein